MQVTVIDFETNGFQGSDVLSFSWAHDKGDIRSDVQSRYYYPRSEYNEKAIAVNGLTQEKIRELRGDEDYPRYYDEDTEFIASVFAHTDVLVAHNIAFDFSFLPITCITSYFKIFCTMKANTKYFDKRPNLKEAAEYYGIEVAEESLHGSAYDVELCLAIYNAMKEEDKEPNDDFLSKVYAARNGDGNMICPFGKWKGFSYPMFTKKDCEEFLEKYNGPHTHEMYEDVFSWDEILMQRIKEKAELLRLASLSPYAQMFSDERQRQITEEGWTPEHDDEHANGELADAAACYAFGGYSLATIIDYDENNTPIFGRGLYPWDKSYFKHKHDHKRQLIIAGALLIAELERLERAEAKSEE